MDGVLNVNKHSGPTSHDIVERVRRATREKRVGHAGTLDPAASGVLLVCLGSATRITQYLMDLPKSYRAEAVFGVETDTEDATGSVIREDDCSHLTPDMILEVLPRFTGEIMQVPPMVSAVRHEGRKLYELARAGRVVERAPRPVVVYFLHLVEFQAGPRPKAVLDVQCSRGTYVRTLCADLGRDLGCGGHMASLVRTAVGAFRIKDAVPIEAVEERAARGELAEVLHSLDEALEGMPSVSVSAEDAARVANGMLLPASQLAGSLPPADTLVRVRGPGDRLLAIGKVCSRPDGTTVLKPEKVFASIYGA
jgi:tRNA pseudouridine55 synthase